jgi:4-nitrophenyl phosphatase
MFDPRKIRGLILDMDGVLWLDTQAIGDLPVIFMRMAQQGLQVVLATNNATRTIEQYVEKVAGFGVALEPWQVVNSSQAAASYLQRRYPQGGSVFVLGMPALVETLAQAGFTHREKEVLAVVGSMDRTVSYEKLKTATLLIRAGAHFVATNTDRTFPTPEGLAPGAGALLAALEAATDVKPVVCGKPSPRMYEMAMERMGLRPEETLVVGDRAETDIAGAQELGCPCALVLSGVTSPAQAQAAAWQPAPDWIEADLEAVVRRLGG